MQTTSSTGLHKAGQNTSTGTCSALLGNHPFLLQWTSSCKDFGSTHPLLCGWPHEHPTHSPRVSCGVACPAARRQLAASHASAPWKAPAPARSRAALAAGPAIRAFTASPDPEAGPSSVREEDGAAREPGTMRRRQNKARVTNESSQRCRGFPAQRPRRFPCEIVTLGTFIGAIRHTYCSLNLHMQAHTSTAPLASGPCLERPLQMHIATDKHPTSHHGELQGSTLLRQYV